VILLIKWCYALFEIKYLIISSILLFEIGSAVYSVAPTINGIIISRVITSLGGVGIYLR
jgi:predicted MFS family arabinose efflux permease